MKLQQRRWIYFGLTVLLLLMASSVFADDGEHRDGLAFFQAFALPRVWVSLIIGVIGLVILIKGWASKTLRLAAMGVALFLFGILEGLHWGAISEGMGMHPSPMCMLEKPFMFIAGGNAVPIFFFGMIASVAIISLIGNKLFCGWVCPIGALQELLHRLPLPKFKVPFKISNSVRIGFFAVFLIVLFTTGKTLYEYVNPFEFFHWTWYIPGVIILSVVILAGLFVYRPFCYFLCPMGLFTWLFEHVALFRVYKDNSSCGTCTRCIDEAPCSSVKAIVDNKWSRPDCHACGACIEICPGKKLSFSMKKSK